MSNAPWQPTPIQVQLDLESGEQLEGVTTVCAADEETAPVVGSLVALIMASTLDGHMDVKEG